MKTKTERETCVVCGAATSFGPTCDALCKRAYQTGRTRPGQIKAEIHAADRAERAREISERLWNRVISQSTDDLNYNRPYLSAVAA